MNTALKEALHTIPKDQFNTCSEALHDFKQSFGVDVGINNGKWLEMPRKFARSAARFTLPINTQKLATMTPFDYLSRYVWISDHRKHLYRFIFNKYICEPPSQEDANNESDKDEFERDTPSRTTNEKSLQSVEFRECVVPFTELRNAFKNVLGYCGPVDHMSEKVSNIIQLTGINASDHEMINFRSWCGLVAFSERYLNDMPFQSDPCDEVSKNEQTEFKFTAHLFRMLTISITF